MLALDRPKITGHLAGHDQIELRGVWSITESAVWIIEPHAPRRDADRQHHLSLNPEQSTGNGLAAELTHGVLHPLLEKVAHLGPVLGVLGLVPTEEPAERVRIADSGEWITAVLLDVQSGGKDGVGQSQRSHIFHTRLFRSPMRHAHKRPTDFRGRLSPANRGSTYQHRDHSTA